MFFENLRFWRLKRRWKKYGRKKLFTWVYRYLRLHKELLEDPIYQEMLDYHRATLIAYLKKDFRKKMSEEKLGEVVDVLADMFNESSPERVNAYKPLVDDIHENWKNMRDVLREIRI